MIKKSEIHDEMRKKAILGFVPIIDATDIAYRIVVESLHDLDRFYEDQEIGVAIDCDAHCRQAIKAEQDRCVAIIWAAVNTAIDFIGENEENKATAG